MTERKVSPVPVYNNILMEQFFDEIHPKRSPVILRGLDIGSCLGKWTAEYLLQNVGNKPVKIHVSETGQMNFLTKNFHYKTLPFDQVIKRSSENEHENFFLTNREVYYLRALGTDSRG
jgi:tRNA wybutosine-synthesizing protein 5